ncbi:PP2C family protein-serine/threonine phosphatase [Aeromicrobium duanguangcaii]|uniref:Protein phosphatase 2C domain-containing protein n=1 Tax=Aeromicrobium duanguangcaii TaxID=2968086 RepID=A0ABY5KHT6_9ACTN|nr:protein phosphatase 2C domain-containing protein [Aeromicrobium duanguangcaii]MCD9154344.1 protein phosphatase 2C domain-containing protein [Aeromicrobium duanguangcaii]UUI68590.1 protein phosphatase 2C domain-containing protein [Aeromicrobium duanguangcaii]
MASLTYRYVALTDVGLRRSNNQDSGYASPRLLVIADGMGGAAAGDLASSAALAEIRELDRDLDPEEDGDALDAMRTAVAHANHRLAELIHDDPAVEGMGTTLEAMLWDGEKLAVAHIGDSRAYRLRHGQLSQLSLDHTFVQSLVDEGRITAEEARVHPHRSLLLKAILGRDDFEPDFTWLQPSAGDRYLLCSDGLTDMVDDATIERTMRLETIDIAATELIRLALEAGGYDNVTVVVAEFVSADEPEDEDLVCADGKPQIVGAATNQPRGRTGSVRAATSSSSNLTAHTGAVEADPEELRYAPRPVPRRRWVRWVLVAVVIVGLLGGAGAYAYDWSQRQYFVAPQDGQVAIFRGVDLSVPGLTLAHLDEVTRIQIDTLPAYQRDRVSAGITAADHDEAQRIVTNLSIQAVEPTPTPTPTPSPTPRRTRATPKPTETP